MVFRSAVYAFLPDDVPIFYPMATAGRDCARDVAQTGIMSSRGWWAMAEETRPFLGGIGGHGRAV
jgi:hypothetical protein